MADQPGRQYRQSTSDGCMSTNLGGDVNCMQQILKKMAPQGGDGEGEGGGGGDWDEYSSARHHSEKAA